MSCLKNPQKFLWIKYNGEHNYKPIKVWKFMDTSSCFIARFRCSLCGCEDERHFLEWEDLLNYGIPNEQIQKIGTITAFSDESLHLNYI